MKCVSMARPVPNMVQVPECGFDKDYRDIILGVYMKLLAQAFSAFPGLFVSVLPGLRSAASTVSEKQASFPSDICEAEASGYRFEEAYSASKMSDNFDDNTLENLCEVNPTIYGEVGKGPDLSKRMRPKDCSTWLVMAKNKDDDEEEDEWDDGDDDEEENDDAPEEEDAGDDGEGQEEVENRDDGGGDDDDDEDDDDDDDDENGKGDDEEDDEDAVEAEDEEDEDAGEDEEDEDEEEDDDEDEDDETPEPPLKKRK